MGRDGSCSAADKAKADRIMFPPSVVGLLFLKRQTDGHAFFGTSGYATLGP